MAAPLSIEQMILNHNISVNMVDADTIGGHSPSEFSLVSHKHSAADITSGIFPTTVLPTGTVSAKGIIQLSNNTGSTDQTTAVTPYALSQVKAIADSKASATHKHNPSDINAGTFPGRMVAKSETAAQTPIIRNIIISALPPTSSDGQDGDLYFIYKIF
jgi:hypothetical protein